VTPEPLESLETTAVSENVPFGTMVDDPPWIKTEIGCLGVLLPHPPTTNANASATYIMSFNARSLTGASGNEREL
jgi:hypothetical protein